MTFQTSPPEPFLNIDPTRQPVLNHRSGWAFALQALAPLHNPHGVLFDSFVERTFSWVERGERKRGRIPYREPWLGIFHNPPGVPRWHDYHSAPQAILARDSFRESLPHCVGLFTLSEYLRRWIAPRVPVPVSTLTHPTEIPEVQFSAGAFLRNQQPAVIQIGWWLRRFRSIFQLRAERYRKVMLAVGHRYFNVMLRRDRDRTALTEEQRQSVSVIPFLSNEEYDRFLSENIVFCHLFDSSANNVVIECIARNTPILINRLPAVEEYLGRDYPLYFSDLDEAATKLARRETVLAAHQYLRGLSKERFSQQAFRNDLLQSEAYRCLCRRRPCFEPSPLRDNRDRQTSPEFELVLSRSASGTVYVERAEFPIANGRLSPVVVQTLQGLVCGQPVSTVRQWMLEEFLRHIPSSMATEGKSAFEAFKLALDRT
ncbi:MAG: glycosyltransferase family 1 protein [Planctomycetaceae bacterium]